MFNKRFWTGKNIIFIILVITLLLILPKIIGILMLFFAAYILACALNPFVTKLTQKVNRTAAASIVMATSVLVIIAMFIPIFIVVFNEVKEFVSTLPEKITGVSSFFMNLSIYGQKLTDIIDFDKILNGSAAIAQGVVNHSLEFTAALVQIIIIIVAMTMIIYYILIDKAYLKNKFLEFFPPDLKGKALDILSTISNKVGQYVRAQALSMIAVGVMVAIVLMILGVEYSTLLGLVSGILDIIPILGPSIALCAILLVAFPMGITKFVLVIIGFLIVQQLSNYVVRPFLFGKMMSLHPLMIFLALFLAQQFLGFWGVILSPAIAATVCVLIDELYLKPINLKAKE